MYPHIGVFINIIKGVNMINIVRCILPDGVHRFGMFTVSDYRDFLLIRNDLMQKSEAEQHQIINELLEELYPDFPPSWRPYIFLNVFTSSIGKSKIPIIWECPKCGKSKRALLDLQQPDLKNPSVDVAGITIEFKFPSYETNDLVSIVKNNIVRVSDDENSYLWEDISDELKLNVIDAIDVETFETIIKMMKPIYIHFRLKCDDYEKDVFYTDILDLFNLVIQPDEIFSFYQINHVLVKNQYDLNSVMSMIPIERSIALSMIEKDNKK